MYDDIQDSRKGSPGYSESDDDYEEFEEIYEMLEEDLNKGTSNEYLPSTPEPSTEKHPNKRAQRFSSLAEQVVAFGGLLISESGQTFAYQKDRGFFKPIPKLDTYLAGYFGKDITNSLLSKDL